MRLRHARFVTQCVLLVDAVPDGQRHDDEHGPQPCRRGAQTRRGLGVAVPDRVGPVEPLDVPRHRTAGKGIGLMIAMITYSARTHRSPVPVEQIANSWIDRLDQMLTALIRDRDTIGPNRSMDVRFDDFMADELGVTERVYGLAGEPFTDEARAAIGDHLAGHRRGRLGNVETSYEMFDLDEGNLRERFAPYVERFLA